MPKKDYYKLLGVSKEAGTAEIKRAFKKLAKECHPDLHAGDKAKEARFKEINEANSVLTDEKKRADYDYAQKMGFDPSMGPYGGGRGGPGMGGPFGGGGGGLEDLFSNFFDGRGGAPSPPKRGTDIESGLLIDFMQAVLGAEFKITVKRGKKSEKIDVNIPRGVESGVKVKLAGKGNPGSKGGPAGDLYIVTRVKPHAYFTRKGASIYLDLPITIKEALLGASITVPTLYGKSTVKVPASTQGGQKLRIKGAGVKGVGRGKGDMYLNITISVPKKINKRSKELVEEFSDLNSYEPRRTLW
jgi:molecular chaperone DnaJ